MANDDSRLVPGEKMVPGESISSPNGNYDLIMQHDGNLVLYRDVDNRAIWASGTDGKAVAEAVMQHDGNLVLYGYNHNALWSSDTYNHSEAYLDVQNDGNVVIYDPFYEVGAGHKALWSTDTWMY